MVEQLSLRAVAQGDLEWMFRLQLDPESNRMAATHPRQQADFFNHWHGILKDAEVTPRVILLGGERVGCVAAFPRDGQTHVAYWIEPAHWGRGIATKALGILLEEVRCRPLHATVAVTNGASFRVLAKNGFESQGLREVSASERYPAHTEILMKLA